MSAPDPELLSLFCEEVSDVLEKWEGLCLSLEKNPTDVQPSLQALFRSAHNLKGSSRALGFLDFGNFIHKIEDGITLLRDQKIPVTSERVKYLLEAHSAMVQWVQNVREDSNATLHAGTLLSDFASVFECNVTDSKVPESKVVESNVSTEASVEMLPDARAPQSRENVLEMPALEKKQSATSPKVKRDESIRVSTLKLDQLIQTIGELSINQNIIHHNMAALTKDRNMIATIHATLGLTKEIYEKSLSLRMQPVTQLFQRLERAARDLARDLGKQLNVVLEGVDVELDKGILERILDPLTHIVRNSVDHGIESIEKRLDACKEVTGTLKISASNDNDGVVVVVEDDGKGLDQERILAKAKEKGLVKANQILTESEINQLIFLPGFSTAEKVTDVSGRGVGMDVVRKTLDEFNGTLDVTTQKGKGTRIAIKLPTSFSIIDATIVQIGEQKYAVPSNDIDEVIREKTAIDGTVLELRNEVLPFFPLSNYLPDRNRSHRSTDTSIVTKMRSRLFALGVDKVFGQQQIVVRPLEESFVGVFGFSGGTILGSGEPAFILNLDEIVSRFVETESSQGGGKAA